MCVCVFDGQDTFILKLNIKQLLGCIFRNAILYLDKTPVTGYLLWFKKFQGLYIVRTRVTINNR